MESENQETLNKILELTGENNRMLRKMRRSIIWGRIFHALYWLLIIGLTVGAYYYIQPYLSAVLSTFGAASDTVSGLEKFLTPEFLKNLQK